MGEYKQCASQNIGNDGEELLTQVHLIKKNTSHDKVDNVQTVDVNTL